MGFFSFIGDAIGDITGASGVEKQAKRAAESTLQIARESRELNIERYGEAKDRLSPYISSEADALSQMRIEMGLDPGEAGTAYMQTPGYQNVMDESLRAVEQSATTSGATTYGGRRLEAASEVGASVQQSYYNNYMSMLSKMSQPTTTTNLSSLGVGQGASIGNQAIQAQTTASNYMMEGAGARQAAIADVIQGGTAIAGAFI